MPSQEEIDNHQELLATHRRTLHICLSQLAKFGHQHAPPSLLNSIWEHRQQIERIKAYLREAGVEVQDLPGDSESTVAAVTQSRPVRSFWLPATAVAGLLIVIVLVWRSAGSAVAPPPNADGGTQSAVEPQQTQPSNEPTLTSATSVPPTNPARTQPPNIPTLTPAPPAPSSAPDGQFQVKCQMPIGGYETRAIGFSPDSTRLATVGSDRQIHIWDIETCTDKKILTSHTEIITSLSWSPDNTMIASGSDDGTVRIWDVATQKEIASFTQDKDSQRVGVLAVAWDPKGDRIASTGFAGWVTVATIDNGVVTKKEFIDFDFGDQKGNSIAWWGGSPARLAVSGFGSFWIIDPDMKSSTPTSLLSTSDETKDIAWSPNGQCLAIAGQNSSIYIVPNGQWATQLPLEGASGNVIGLTWLHDGRWLASVGGDQPALFWDVASGTKLAFTLPGTENDRSRRIAWSSKNNLLAIASEEMLKIWSLPVDTLAAATVQSDSARPTLEQTKGCIGPRP